MREALLKAERATTALATALACAMLALAALLGLWQIVTRFILQQPAEWTEVLIRFSLIWMVFLGIPLAFRLGAMVSVDVLHRAGGPGLRRVLGKADIYRRLLSRFVQDHAASPTRLADALQRPDRAQAAQILHALKGVASNISAVEVTRSVLDRIAQVNPRINALAEVMAEEAMAAAQASDAALARGQAPGALHGVPLTIKVNVDTAGHATTDGGGAQKDTIAATDSPLVAHLDRKSTRLNSSHSSVSRMPSSA